MALPVGSRVVESLPPIRTTRQHSDQAVNTLCWLLQRGISGSEARRMVERMEEDALLMSTANRIHLIDVILNQGREEVDPWLTPEAALNQAWDEHSDLPLLLRDLEEESLQEAIAVTQPTSTARLPEEIVPGNGSCVVCMEGTAEMLLCSSNGKPSCSHICMCEYCAHELSKTSPECPLCRKAFVVSKLFKLNIQTPPPRKRSRRRRRRLPSYESATKLSPIDGKR